MSTWQYMMPTENGGKRYIEEDDLLPCPKCNSKNLEAFANVISCQDCDHSGPAQKGPEFACDWRDAIVDWNNAVEAVRGNSE